MDRATATASLEVSCRKGSSTPDFGAADRLEYLQAEQSQLLTLVIDPIAVMARTSEWAKSHADLQNPEYAMAAIAGVGESWLLYDTDTQLFSLACGSPASGLELVGFASTDALFEWKG